MAHIIYPLNAGKALINSLLICILFNIASFNVYAQTDEERSEMGKMYLDKMSQKNKKYTTIKTTFTITIDNKQENSKNDYNGVLLAKGNMYRLELMNNITFFNGNTVCTWLVNDNEANITDAEDAADAAIGPMQLLGAYENGYKMRYMQDVKIGNSNCVEVDLYPTDRKTNITRVRLTIEKDSYTIKRIMQQGKDGTSYFVNINTFTTGNNIDDKEFTFDPKAHPEVEVVDLR
ncbi:MAG: outer membrane lipoprotein carrier protein LolA [Bacteroidales bacterium]|nr:outer membrane lipoprotein carrier protein LolA [Bacteroidales bacterium]